MKNEKIVILKSKRKKDDLFVFVTFFKERQFESVISLRFGNMLLMAKSMKVRWFNFLPKSSIVVKRLFPYQHVFFFSDEVSKEFRVAF